MKRKRFVKLVMSQGIQRNEAERMARNVAVFGSYKSLYEHYRLMLAFRPAILAFRRMGKAFKKAVEKQFKAFKAAFAGLDLASGADHTAIIHNKHTEGRSASILVCDEIAEIGTLEVMAKEEHEAAHAVK